MRRGQQVAKEKTLPDDSKKDEAQRQFSKLQKAEDGKKAMSEYEAEAAAIRAKTERLRALRLARDAALAADPASAGAKPVRAKAGSKPSGAKKSSSKKQSGNNSTLADWLNAQEASGRRR
jgi:hypothetical protein